MNYPQAEKAGTNEVAASRNVSIGKSKRIKFRESRNRCMVHGRLSERGDDGECAGERTGIILREKVLEQMCEWRSILLGVRESANGGSRYDIAEGALAG